MIFLIHGPIGCGKSTAVREWLAEHPHPCPRGYYTYFEGGVRGASRLCLASWDGRISLTIARRLSEVRHARDAINDGTPPYGLDGRRFWRAVRACVAGDPVRPLIIDELGLLETRHRPGVRFLKEAVEQADTALLVVQDRALSFWSTAISALRS